MGNRLGVQLEKGDEVLVLGKYMKDEEASEEERTFVFPLPAGATTASVLLLFKTFPIMPDDAAFVIGRWP